jgi:hypothetical protein
MLIPFEILLQYYQKNTYALVYTMVNTCKHDDLGRRTGGFFIYVVSETGGDYMSNVPLGAQSYSSAGKKMAESGICCILGV